MRLLAKLEDLPLAIDRQPDGTATMDLARRYRLTVYDASYLELALRRGAALATLDRRLAAAAAGAGVTVIGTG